MNHNTPLLSIVVTARNDDYGGNLVNRIQTFVKVLARGADKNKFLCELVFVEYNPPAGKELFTDTLTLAQNAYFKVRFILVPNSFHLRFATHTKIPLLEYIAKNIGARRALGTYILVANPDVLLSPEIFEYIGQGQLTEKSFYRVNRHDIRITTFSEHFSAEEIIALAKQKSYLAWMNDGARYSWSAWWSRFIHGRNLKSFKLCPAFKWFKKDVVSDELHVRAAGDFLLMHRTLWDKVSGYEEVPLSSYLDGYILYVAKCFGAKQVILPYPIYHIDHAVGKGGRPEVAHQKYEKDVQQMESSGVSYRPTDPNWGQKNQKFDEKQA